MNTAEPLIDEYDAVYSPRRQGAGLMNLYGAVSTPVTVTDASTNEAKVELKDFDSKNFSMTLRAANLSDDEVTYRVDTSVLTDEILNYQGTEYNLLGTVEMDAVVDAPETVTVPANGSTEFTINVDFSEDQNVYRNMFVEGFVTLTEVTDTHPTLSVPYVGFYGDWTEPSIIDGFKDLGEIPFYGMSGMVDTETYFMVPGKAAISPETEDGKSEGTDTVTPVLSFLRNAEEVQYNILDKDKNSLRTIKIENFVRKTYTDDGASPEYSFSLDRLWDGKVNGKTVEDGLYYYQIKSKLQNTDKWQEKDIPVYVDTAAPEITDASYDSGKIKFKVEDATSGFRGYAVWIDGQQAVEFTKETEVPEDKDEYEIDITDKVSGKTDPKIQLVVFDYALNSSVKTVSYKEESGHPVIYITGPVLLDAYNTKTVPIEGAVFDVNNPVIKVNGKEVEAVEESNIIVHNPENFSSILREGPGYTFSTTVEMKDDGYNTVQVEVTSAEGKSDSISRSFLVDTEAPKISASFKEWKPETKEAVLTVHMTDNIPILTLYAGDSMVYSVDDTGEVFSNIEPIDKEEDITVYAGDEDSVTLKLVDCAGNEAVLEVPIEKTGDSQGSNHEKADDVIDLINNIPSLESLTLDDKGYVESVREAYDDLSQTEKESVDNTDILISAENRISELENGLKEEVIPQE
jgi:lactocepin